MSLPLALEMKEFVFCAQCICFVTVSRTNSAICRYNCNELKLYRVTQKKRELLKNPTKIEEIQEKKLLTEIEPLQLAF